jgi:glycosyltransferase involved in cell wall biosynthesis
VPEERAAFAAAVTRVLTQPALRAALAREARAHVVEHWSSAVMTRRMLALYERTAEAHARAATPRDDARTRALRRAPLR